MARLPYVDPEGAPEEVRQTFDDLPVQLNIFRMLAHAHTALRPFLRLGTAILGQQKLSHPLRELAILRVARLSGSEYEWVQHVAIAKAVGATDAQVEAIERGDVEADCFDEPERAILRFTTEVVNDVRASDAAFADVSGRFTPQEVVELLLAIGFYMMVARLLETTGVDVEPSPASTIAAAARRG